MRAGHTAIVAGANHLEREPPPHPVHVLQLEILRRRPFGARHLYQVRAFDPLILVVAVSAVSALAVTAYSLSALRGARVDAGTALKAQ